MLSMNRNRQLSRILRIMHHLQINPQGLKAKDILNKLKSDGHTCSKETLYRDFKALQTALIPIEQSEDTTEARWKLSPVVQVNSKVAFSYDELLALYISKSSMRIYEGGILGEQILSLFSKLEKILGIKSKESLEELENYLGIKPRVQWTAQVSKEILDTVHASCAEGHVLEIDYLASSGEQKGQISLRRVFPEFIYFADAGAYLLARDLSKNENRTYALSRIKSARMTDEVYEGNRQKIDTWLNHQFGILSEGLPSPIVLEISEPMASYVAERRWHESQKVIRLKDSIRVEMLNKINQEFVQWILSLGGCVKIIEPEQLKKKVIDEAQLIIDRNSGKRAA